jgi:hypothetical protein
MLLYGSGMSDSNQHSPDNLPVLLVGGKGVGLPAGGRHIRYPKATPFSNLHLALLEKMGVRMDKFGDSTGRLDLLSL